MRLNPLDAVWLLLESRDTPMHVGTLAIFSKPANAPKSYLQDLIVSLRAHKDPAPPWNQRLADAGARTLAARLQEERGFDLDYHVRHTALPKPGGERELGVVVSRLHSEPLDRNRPLWEFHLIEGLERGRFAFYLKIHHALIDNVNAVPLLLDSLAATASARKVVPFWSHALELSEGDERSFDVVGSLQSLGGSLGDSMETLSSLGQATRGALHDYLRRDGQGSFLLPRGTPRSTLNRRINSQRRFATQQFSLRRISSLAERADCTVNTLLAYLCGSSLRRFFKEYNALPDESLIAALPVSLQERSELLPGNAIAGLRVALGTHIGDPLERLQAVKLAMQQVRQDRESLPDAAAVPYIMMRSAPVYASQVPLVGRFVPPLFNLSVSNTPGSKTARYCAGARLEAIYPMNPLFQYNALSIDCVNYAGSLNIGFTGARDTLPHLQRLAVYTGLAVDDLEQLLGKRRRSA